MKLPRNAGYYILGIVVFLFLFGNDGFRKMVRRYWELHHLGGELQQLRKESSLLHREVYFLEEDATYVERIARRELGLISPDEVEYRFNK